MQMIYRVLCTYLGTAYALIALIALFVAGISFIELFGTFDTSLILMFSGGAMVSLATGILAWILIEFGTGTGEDSPPEPISRPFVVSTHIIGFLELIAAAGLVYWMSVFFSLSYYGWWFGIAMLMAIIACAIIGLALIYGPVIKPGDTDENVESV